MTRRITLLFVFLLLCASSAWPKFKEDELKQLDEKFQPVMEQIQALQTQIQTLNTQLQELRQNQAQFQAVIIRQQRALQAIDQMVSSMRLGGEDHYSTLKTAIENLRKQTETSFNKIQPGAGQGGPTVGVTPPPPPQQPRPAMANYVMSVEGNTVLVDLTSAQGIQQGARLALYKASDPNTRVGVLEVTQVQDSGSRARIVTINSGVKPEFGDIVRLEQ